MLKRLPGFRVPLVLLVGLSQGSFAAFSTTARANVVANGPQNFNAAPDGLDFLTVQSSETLHQGIINLGVFFNYAVNSLPYSEKAGQTSNKGNGLLGMDLNFAVGLLPNWEVGLSTPFVLAQHVSDTDAVHGQFGASGMTEVRPSTKVRVWHNDTSGVALVGAAGVNTTSNNPFRGVDPGTDLTFETAFSTHIKRFNVGLNLGYRWMRPGSDIPGSFIMAIGDQWIASAAGSYLFEGTQNKLITEVYSSLPASDRGSDSNRASSSLELLVGVKHDVNHNLAWQTGVGAGLIQGVSSPDVRLYAGLNYAFGPVFEHKKADEPVVERVIPVTPAEPKQETLVTRGITFEFDSTQMTGEYRKALDEFVAVLKKGGDYRSVIVTGHSDSMGSETYNQKLSERRAGAIREYLIRNYALDGNRISAVGKGPAEPVADNGNFQGRLLNRRVEFTINR
jgi:outer membrane protein OmpA-like peptidoglycan-associated protein